MMNVECLLLDVQCILYKHKRRRGFTLIELLVAIGILGVVAGVIAACLAGGVRVWDVARKFNTTEAEAYIGLMRLEKDLMNSFRFRGIGFKGTSKEISFPGLIGGESRFGDDSSETVERIGTIKYYSYVDRTGGVLKRKTWRYGETEDSLAEEIVTGLKQVEIRYYFSGAGDKDDGWRDTWDDATNFPSAVRMELSFVEDGESAISRTVVLPVAASSIMP